MQNINWKNLSDSKMGYLYCVGCAILSCLIGMLLPGLFFLPILNAIFLYPIYYKSVSEGRLHDAFYQMLFWTCTMSIMIIGLTIFFPNWTGAHIFRGYSYRDEMFQWVRTGIGAESNPREFLPIHITHFIIFTLLTFLTGGLLGLIFGSILLNYMNFYIGSLISESHFAWQSIFLGWQIWAIVRVLGYIIFAIALSHLFFVYFRKKEFNRQLTYQYLIAGLHLVVMDIILKWTLAPEWQKILEPILP